MDQAEVAQLSLDVFDKLLVALVGCAGNDDCLWGIQEVFLDGTKTLHCYSVYTPSSLVLGYPGSLALVFLG